MITFISEEQLKKKIKYSQNEFIPEKMFKSFTPQEYIESYGYSEESITYLKKIRTTAKYIEILLTSYQIIIDELQSVKEQETDTYRRINKNGGDCELIISKDELYGELNYKEKLASIRINSGKKVYKELIDLLKNPFVDKEIKKLIEETKEKRKNLPEENRSYGNYKNIHPEENDIYFYFLLDAKKKIEEILPKYFTADSYFTNTGTSYFVLKPDDYLYLVGTARGKIKEFQKFLFFMKNLNSEFFKLQKSNFNIIMKDIDAILLPYYNSQSKNTNNINEKKQKLPKKRIAKYKAMDENQLKELFFAEYNVPKHFFEVLKIKHWNNVPILLENNSINPKADFPLFVNYLKSTLRKTQMNNDLLKVLFNISEDKNISDYLRDYKDDGKGLTLKDLSNHIEIESQKLENKANFPL